MAFTGTFDHNLDAKNRLTIPSKFRAALSGGEGKMFGTLTGAFTIAVIQNGMNLTNIESYTQKVVLGLVILGAVLIDRIRHR